MYSTVRDSGRAVAFEKSNVLSHPVRVFYWQRALLLQHDIVIFADADFPRSMTGIPMRPHDARPALIGLCRMRTSRIALISSERSLRCVKLLPIKRMLIADGINEKPGNHRVHNRKCRNWPLRVEGHYFDHTP